jgi:hypothetical protein
MTPLLILFCALCWAVLALTWVGYPVWLHVRARTRPHPVIGGSHPRWPTVTIVAVVHNAEAPLRPLLQSLLALGYPKDLRRILVVSNASTDFTDAMAALYAEEGVELLKVLPPRRPAAVAENLARAHVHSDLVVVLRPAARPRPAALAALVAPFADPTVGVAYGREVSAVLTGQGARIRRSLYGRYEAWLRDRETDVFSTVSARASLYAVRGELFRLSVPAARSPDFAPILTARERGYRAVYAPDAECVVMRDQSLRSDYRRTVQAAGRDVATLLAMPHLLDPRRYGAFAIQLLGHKLGRWLTPWALAGGIGGLVLLASGQTLEKIALVLAAALCLDALIAWRVPQTALGRLAALPGRFAASLVAMGHALLVGLTTGAELQLEAAAVRALWVLMTEVGFGPSLDVCARDGAPIEAGESVTFSAAEGGALCARCTPRDPPARLPPADYEALRALADRSQPLPPLDAAHAAAHRRLVARFVRHHVGEVLTALDSWERHTWAKLLSPAAL